MRGEEGIKEEKRDRGASNTDTIGETGRGEEREKDRRGERRRRREKER